MVCGEGIKNRLEILKLLLESGADPNQVAYDSDEKPIRTILGEYISANIVYESEVIELLLRYGAEVS